MSNCWSLMNSRICGPTKASADSLASLSCGNSWRFLKPASSFWRPLIKFFMRPTSRAVERATLYADSPRAGTQHSWNQEQTRLWTANPWPHNAAHLPDYPTGTESTSTLCTLLSSNATTFRSPHIDALCTAGIQTKHAYFHRFQTFGLNVQQVLIPLNNRTTCRKSPRKVAILLDRMPSHHVPNSSFSINAVHERTTFSEKLVKFLVFVTIPGICATFSK